MKKHYFTKQSISDFIITPKNGGYMFYINLISGEQLTYWADSKKESDKIEDSLLEMLSSKIYTIIGCIKSDIITFHKR